MSESNSKSTELTERGDLKIILVEENAHFQPNVVGFFGNKAFINILKFWGLTAI